MSAFDMSDKHITAHALGMWKNYLQTGDVCLSTQDAINCGTPEKCNRLDSQQQELVNRLDDLICKQLNA